MSTYLSDITPKTSCNTAGPLTLPHPKYRSVLAVYHLQITPVTHPLLPR